MKKFLQKSSAWLVMLVAWFAVSATAWADQTVLFDYNQGDGITATKDDVTVTFGSGWIHYGLGYGNYVGSGGTYYITVSADSDIKSVVIDNEYKTVNGDTYQNYGNYYVSNWSSTYGSISRESNGDALVSSIPDGVRELTVTVQNASTNVNQITVTVADAVAADPMDYTVVVSGISDPNAGVVYKGTTVHDNETLHGVVGLTAEKVTPVAIEGYEGVVTLDGSVFTVTYKKLEYVEFEFTGSTLPSKSGVTFSLSTNNMNTGSGLNVWNTSWHFTVNSSEFDIAKIEVFENTSKSLSNLVTVPGGFDSSTNTWTGESSSVKFTGGTLDVYIKKLRIYFSHPEPVEAPEFPVENVAYEVKNVGLDMYVNVKDHATEAGYLSADNQALYFTWDEMKAGFTIQNEEGYYLGKSDNNGWNMSSTNPEYWTVETVSEGVYAFKAKSSKYLAPNSYSDYRLMRDKDNSAYYTFTISEYVAPSFFESLALTPADGATVPMLGEYTLTAPEGVTFAENLEINGKVKVNGYDNYVWLRSVEGNKVVVYTNDYTNDGDYTVKFPAKFLVSEDGVYSPAITATYTVFNPTFYFQDNDSYNNGSLKSLSSIELNYNGTNLDAGTTTVTILIDGEEVEAEAVCTSNKATITFDAITIAGSHLIKVPAETFTAADGKKKNVETYVWVKLAATLKIAEGTEWTTFALDAPFTLGEGYTAYIVTGTQENGQLELKALEAGEPVSGSVTLNCDDIQGDNRTISQGNDKPYIVSDSYIQASYYEIYSNSNSLEFTFHAPEGGVITKITPKYDPGFGDIEWEDGQINGNVEPNAATYTARCYHPSDQGYVYIWNFAIEYEAAAAIIPAYEGILVNGPANTDIPYTKKPGATPSDVTGNLLQGCTWSHFVEDDAAHLYYKFSLDADNTAGSEGFYWYADGGHSIQMNVNKAYLVLDTPAASNSRYLINGFGDETLTGLDSVIAPEAAEAIFNLQGQRVGAAKGGVYVKGGKKFIVK